MSLNLYTYCLNNPHKYTDPSGHFAITAGIVIGAIIWGLVGAGIEYKMQKDAGGIIDYNHVIFQGTLNTAIALISGGTANGMMAAQQGTRMTARTFGRMMLMEAGFGVAEGIIGETGYQLIEGKKLKDLSAGKIAVSGAMGGVSGVGGALAGEAIGAGLKVLKNTRVVSKAINTMQDMASRGKNAIRRGVDKLADFGRHQLGLDSVAYVTPEGLVVRGPRVPDNGMRLFAGTEGIHHGGNNSWHGDKEIYSVIYEVELPDNMYPNVSDARHFQEANKRLYEFFVENPDLAQAMDELYPEIVKGVQPGAKGAFPRTAPTRELTWHHHPESAGVLQLIPRSQHRAKGIIQNVLHPNGKGGMENWGGGQ